VDRAADFRQHPHYPRLGLATPQKLTGELPFFSMRVGVLGCIPASVQSI
jgi:hypothetical protein